MRIHRLLLAPVLAAGMLLAGCAPGYEHEAAEALQARVQTVTSASAASDWAGALTELDLLAADAAIARDEGVVSEARYDRIMAAIALVRAELVAALEAAQAPPAPERGGDNDNGNGNNGNNGNANNGNNGNNGNGNGNGNNGNSGNGNDRGGGEDDSDDD